MKIQYLSVLVIVSILSLGAVASCSNPDAATTNTPSNTGTEVKANPCASKANPCASKANPCASKVNPCASKAKSVGGPLAKELQGKPVVVDVFASWCPGCQNIAPTLSQLKQEYSDKVNFVVLDVTDQAKLQETAANAKKLGLGQFLETTKSQTSTVAIVDPATGNILAMFKNNPNKADYTKILDAALAKN
ncbi:TlpA family protein disulfide reductase [Microseira sp. BLCC-F43]|jgi:thiol-disulfide isomerase/thioredoxin|uniref:TlpA family protein disulfide reductase n=1 Tax=Microseira sp. BLCC-F43 TaxID=3153602 RepID=UPI0035BAED65